MEKQENKIDEELLSKSKRDVVIDDKDLLGYMKERSSIVKEGQDLVKTIEEKKEEVKKMDNELGKIGHKANKLQGKIIKHVEKNVKIDLAEFETIGDIKIQDGGLIIEVIDNEKFWKANFKKNYKK